MLPRVLEPELMDTPEEAIDYDTTTTQWTTAR